MTCAMLDCQLETASNSKYCPKHKKEARENWRAMIAEQEKAKEERDNFFKDLWNKALFAGNKALEACVPTPMIVQEHDNPLDDNSKVVQQWAVPEGPCGFAWVHISPANSALANYFKRIGVVGKGAAYGGGINVWCSAQTQSIERKSAWANAVAKVLKEGMVEKFPTIRIHIYPESRLD